MSVTLNELAKDLDISLEDDKGKLTLSKGVFTLRKEYYWRPRVTPEESFAKNVEIIQGKGYTVTVVECGDKFAAFRGGEGVKKNSHYWMQFRVTKVVP